MEKEVNKKQKLTKTQLERIAVYSTRVIESLYQELDGGGRGDHVDAYLHDIFRRLDGHIVNINRLIDGETFEDIMVSVDENKS